ncbi:MAG: hypothetical protein Q4D41_11655 [Prevotellaceae bacterium]|nr:hypothetical protein [Prevotellaceae bacterium]
MKRILLFSMMVFIALSTVSAKQKRLMFDLAHGQFQDVFVDPSYYDYVIPGYKEILARNGVEYVENKAEITDKSLKGIDVLLILSPLARSTQKPFTEIEKNAIAKFIRKGGSVIMMVDEESHRVILDEYGANDITKQFGIEIGDDITDVPGNCGAISFENEIFQGRREVPYSGSRHLKGGIPASVCMEGGYLHASYVKLKNGGKLYVIAETMVGLLMGYPDGERNVHKMMETRWWGKDSRLYMEELIKWCLKK